MTGQPNQFEAKVGDISRIKQVERTHGFCVIKNFFSKTETSNIIATLGDINRTEEMGLPDIFSCDNLRWLLLDDRILNIAKSVLGPELVYYRESAISYEETVSSFSNNPYDKLHFDARGNEKNIFGLPNIDRPHYPAIRFGIYLQDYKKFSGGLKVVPGSHAASIKKTKTKIEIIYTSETYQPFVYNVPSIPGDVVIWNLKLMHGGGALRSAEAPLQSLSMEQHSNLRQHSESYFLPIPGPRNAIFFDLGSWSTEVDLYAKAQSQQPIESKKLSILRYPEEKGGAVTDAMNCGLTLRNDRVIISLVEAIIEKELSKKKNYSSAPSHLGEQPDPRLLEWRERLLSVCQEHWETTSISRLFNKTEFDELATSNTEKAIDFVIMSVQQRLVDSRASFINK